MIIIVLLVLLILLFYFKMVRIYDYWIKKGVKQRKQVYLFGDNAGIMFGRETVFDAMINLYKTFPEERYSGMYRMTLPILLLRDPELIKQVAVKDFDHFLDHQQFVADGVDPIWTQNLFALRGNEWRQMRTTLSPSFTSSKMRIIFNLISECANNYTSYFKKTDDIKTIELKDTFTRYTNDVIATVAFGIRCDSINDKTNEFYVRGKEATTFDFWRNMRFFAYTVSPELCKVIGMKIFPESATKFFKNLVQDTIKFREKQNIVRPDMLQLLLEARKGKMKAEDQSTVDTGFATVEEVIKTDPPKKFELTDMDIAAQAMIFFFAGFETVSTAMCFMGYELVANPDIQKRLQLEIDETYKKCNEKLTYEALMKMKYMDMVVSEVLRKWPPAIGSDRVCTKIFTIRPVFPNEKPLTIEPGEMVFIPTNAIHRDPKYYPNPDQFDPERFNDENKNDIKPYTYLPFGLGPRNCIGSRFALLEVKTVFFHLLRNFDFVVVDKTDIPVKLCKGTFSLATENGMWIGLKPRKL